MNLAHPEYALLGEHRARLLQRLSALAVPASGRRLHELSGIASLRTTQSILRDLVEVGLVDVNPVGGAHAYSLNREHLLWPPLERILAIGGELEVRLVEILMELLGDRILGAYLYGSLARGEAGVESDLDLLIVFDDDVSYEERVALLDVAARHVERLTGNQAQLFPLTRAELDELIAGESPFVASLQQDARTLVGLRIEELLGPAGGT